MNTPRIGERHMEHLTGRAAALEALRRIDEHPETWDQNSWRCRSGCCFGGYVALAGGWRWRTSPTGLARANERMTGPDGRERHVHLAALEVLFGRGVVIDNELFDHRNTRADLTRLVDEYLPPEDAPASTDGDYL